ncbi:MAG: urea transport system permease protein [Acidimicrobiaceae bacterium]|nr:urea transport system permease protein [Acidimicrobiaceae bacterium]MDQ1367110.1 urea transport system permease protein [Acidimicrobiaceae bacterium]MDQ1401357.1 urea transport system permease protein [Acidimicrobiaceae bacterium]MDQ1419796.1 urea transport system permease protein [Acidimicrobiaceae bacterium]
MSLLLRGPRVAPGRSRRWWLGFGLAMVLLLVVAPVALSAFRLGLLSKYLCFAIVALGIDVAWGYGGMLTLGQGVFFGIGGYAMAMYMKLHQAGAGHLPDFMTWSGVSKLPLIWKPFRYAWVALPAAVLVPVALAVGLGYLIFRQRVRGAYFAILTQALAAAFAIWLVGEQGLTGGTNGLTNFHELLGFNLSDPANQRSLYFVVAGTLLGLFLLARALIQSRYGRLLVAVRDGEDRVRFLGYNPLVVKTLAFAFSAALAGLAGALFVPVVGIISPTLVDVVPSLELLIGVAVGGRGTLYGAIIGAVAVNWAKTGLSEHFASGWLYFQGALFVLVIVYAPGGMVGLWRKGRDAVVGRRTTRPTRTTRTERPEPVSARTVELTSAP